MIKRQYSGNERRARNYIWNAAGRYDFEPSLLAFGPDGSPDMYYNLVIGLAYKWLDMAVILDFIACYSVSRSAEEFDDLFWLGIENCVYEKEIAERPVLAQLRREKAQAYFRSVSNMSRQQMEMQSVTVYDQQMIRWSAVSGRQYFGGKKSAALAKRLRFPGVLDAQGIVSEMSAILRDYFHTDVAELEARGEQKGFLQGLSEAGRSLAERSLAGRLGRALTERSGRAPKQKMFLRTGDGLGDLDTNVRLGHTANRKIHLPTAGDEAFVRAAFGEPAYSAPEMEALEADCCRDIHAACQLHVTDGRSGADGDSGNGKAAAKSSELREILRRAQEQESINRKFISENSLLISESIRELSARLDLLFEEYFRRMPETGRSGTLITEKAYRLAVFQDPSVFAREGTLTERDVEITLLLDASMSRMNVQEIIASEAYIIAKSLERIHIPVQVMTFRAFRGITILERLKRADRSGCDDVLRFFSGGWNRDGLAFRTVRRLLCEESGASSGGAGAATGVGGAAVGGSEKERILIVLTDACPNDDMPAVMDSSGRIVKEYEGVTAVSDTEKAVRDLRKAGIRTAAVFFGSASHLENVQQIYGKEYVRIRKLNRIADSTAELIRMTLQEMTPQEDGR